MKKRFLYFGGHHLSFFMGRNSFILITLLLCCLCQLLTVYAFHFENNQCSDKNGNYTEGSIYQKNLNHTLSNFSIQASSRKFYNSTNGEFPNKVYGLYQCRDDYSLDMCNECIRDATKMITNVCPLYGEGIVWYDECMLRYANRSIFSLSETYPSADSWYQDSVSNYDMLSPVLTSTMDKMISQAIRTTARGHFAATAVDWTSIDSVYCFGQCTPDIGEADCKYCLKLGLAEIYMYYNASKGVTVFYPSCQIGYDTESPLLVHKLPPPVSATRRPKKSSHIGVAVSISTFCAVLFLSGACFCIYRLRHRKSSLDMEEMVGVESLQYDFPTIKDATNNFSLSNKLGEGGFGVVYKGKLRNGQEIAVKRLSIYSGQGVAEFKTEIVLAAKLQHNNLVKLLGFCLHGEEKLLVYEFLPNASLDKVLFGQKRHLDWETRYKILHGAARGLLYLHEDSRLKIIHRDLKPSNILLDENMNPKISDFGLARLVGTTQTPANTSKIAGTYGYMAPEYALTGRFSIMSDVYSYGVITLEIISGHMCSSTTFPYHEDSLCLRAWKLWKDNAALDLVDPGLDGIFPNDEVTRCIHIGLLCIQEDANKRPTMAMIVSALNSLLVTLPEPEPPLQGPTSTEYGFYKNSNWNVSNNFPGSDDFITEIHPR